MTVESSPGESGQGVRVEEGWVLVGYTAEQGEVWVEVSRIQEGWGSVGDLADAVGVNGTVVWERWKGLPGIELG